MSPGGATAGSLAVVTGASSGIGEALARELAARGHRLLLVARRGDVLARLAADLQDRHGVCCEVRAVDLADAEQRAALVQELTARPVDVLCNNAGVASFGAVADLPAAALRAELALDVTAVHDLTLAVLPGMLDRGRGALLFSGSVAGNVPIPHNATYAAAKAFVNHFAEALHHEVAGSGVAVTLLAPGPVRGVRTGEDGVVDRCLPDVLWASTGQAARVALDGLDHHRLRVVPGATGKVLSVLTNTGPRRLLSAALGRFYRRFAA